MIDNRHFYFKTALIPLQISSWSYLLRCELQSEWTSADQGFEEGKFSEVFCRQINRISLFQKTYKLALRLNTKGKITALEKFPWKNVVGIFLNENWISISGRFRTEEFIIIINGSFYLLLIKYLQLCNICSELCLLQF